MGEGDLEQKVGFDPYEPGRASLKGDGRPPMPFAIKITIVWYAVLGLGVGLGTWLLPPPPELKVSVLFVYWPIVAAPLGAALASSCLAFGLRIPWYISMLVHVSLMSLVIWGRGAWFPVDAKDSLFHVISLAIFFSLTIPLTMIPSRSRAALHFLGALCPSCGWHKRKYADFWLNNYLCIKCKTVWPARTWLWALKNRG